MTLSGLRLQSSENVREAPLPAPSNRSASLMFVPSVVMNIGCFPSSQRGMVSGRWEMVGQGFSRSALM